MKSDTAVTTAWTAALARNEPPSARALKEHLLEVHRRNPGFTESCATRCRDAAGRTSYRWLCDAMALIRQPRILDLACGSGVLLDVCRMQRPDARALVGVDMSAAELALARARLAGRGVTLHQGLAQDLSFAGRATFDAVLCHWALTLMDPIEPVLREVARVLAPGGVFAAVVDGDPAVAPGYAAVNDVVFKHVQRELPGYGDHDLGDPRTRTPEALAALAEGVFAGADVGVETSAFALTGPPDLLAKEAAGFFYAAFVLPPPAQARLHGELTTFFAARAAGDDARFVMPICRLIVRP